MAAIVVVGAQWGDEGKGKVVDLYTPYADVVVRYAGGANAGHTLVVAGEKLILRLIPSGILHRDATCIVGQGTVIDPNDFLGEVKALRERGISLDGRLFLSERAHVVLPTHKLVDALREESKGGNAIGTTKRGIGPTYEDKAARRGVRVGDLLNASGRDKIVNNVHSWRAVVESLGGTLPDANAIADEYLKLGEALRPFVRDTVSMIDEAVRGEKSVLLEGAQGTMLDIDHGTYPYVTSSNAIAGGACAGAGIGPNRIDRVVGIAKAYTTRVGSGPFPTELDDSIGEHLRNSGAEFGSVTGRPRRCGWLDLVVLRHAVMVNGLDSIALTKLDVLSGLKELKVCVAYELDGKRYSLPPFDGLERVKPIYETLPGFSEDIAHIKGRHQLPDTARSYLRKIEEEVRCPIGIVSVGPDREATAGLVNPFT
ncbi:MAG: adenylosuccinate synthase [Polyangiales bacterium]